MTLCNIGNVRILQRGTIDFLQRATSVMSNELFFTTSSEQILKWVTSDFLQRATSAASNERILQRVTSDITTSNEQRGKSYVSFVMK